MASALIAHLRSFQSSACLCCISHNDMRFHKGNTISQINLFTNVLMMQMHKISSDSYRGSPERWGSPPFSVNPYYTSIFTKAFSLLSFHLLSRFICSFKCRYILWRSKGLISLQIPFHNYTVLQMEVIAALPQKIFFKLRTVFTSELSAL